MKMHRSLPPFVLLLLALAVASGPTLRAEDTPPPPAEKKTDETKPAETVAPADDKKSDTVAPTAADKAAKAAEKIEQKAEELAEKITEKVDQNSEPAKKKGKTHRSRGHDDGPPLGSHTVPSGTQSNTEAVSIFGTTTVDGDIDGEAVSVFGATVVNGNVAGESVAVFGPLTVNGHVGGEAVAVFGDLTLGPKAVVDGDVVVVFGEFHRDPEARVHGQVNHVSFGPFNAFLNKCLLRGRLLGIGENLGWPWLVAAGFLLFYCLLALLFPKAIESSVETLEQRPGGTVLAAFLAMLLTPILSVLLVVTGIGIALVPFIGLAVFFGTLFGKAAVHAWLGRRLAKVFGSAVPPAPVAAVVIGGVFLSLLYMIPILGLLLWKLFGALGLGMVVYRLALLSQREKRPVVPVAVVATSTGAAAVGGSPSPEAVFGAAPPPVVPAALPPISAVTLPRAGFWIRIAASLLDAILIGMLVGFLSNIWRGFGSAFPFWFALYCMIMWATKGTTIGGIICGLKVVRLDDRPVDWSVSIVRTLGGFLSLCVAGLGFIWVAFDNDKQSWHDKIAGTTIVRVPKGTPLL